MTGPTLDGVDPERREETLRRIGILDRYATVVAPTRADDDAYAREVGVGIAQFLRLARVWTEYRDPSLLPGTARRRRRPARPMTETARSIVEDVVRNAPAEARNSDLTRLAAHRLAGAGLPPVDASVVWSASMRLGAAVKTTIGNERMVAIDQVGVDLPVDADQTRRLPILQTAFRADTGRILAWRLGHEALDEAAASALLSEVVGCEGEAADGVLLPVGDGQWLPLRRVLAHAGLERGGIDQASASERIARRTFGMTIGGLAIRSRTTRRADARRPTSVMDMERARNVVRQAARLHNSAPGRATGLSLTDDSVREAALRSALVELGKGRLAPEAGRDGRS